MTAVTLLPVRPGVIPGVGSVVVTTCFPARVTGQGGVVIQLVFPATNGFVVWEPHSGRKQSCVSFYFLRV